MKAHVLVFFVALSFAMFAPAKDLIRIGYIEYPPLVSVNDDTEVEGPLIDYIEQGLAPAFDIRWIKIPFGRVRWGYENDFIDAFPFYIYAPEREAWAVFPNKPYLTFQSIICSRLDHETPAASLLSLPDDMFDATLVYPLNAKHVFPFLHNPRIKLVKLEYTNYKDRSLALLNYNRVDYILFPSSDGVGAQLLDKLSCIAVGEKQSIFFTSRKDYPHIDQLDTIFDKLAPFEYK